MVGSVVGALVVLLGAVALVVEETSISRTDRVLNSGAVERLVLVETVELRFKSVNDKLSLNSLISEKLKNQVKRE